MRALLAAVVLLVFGNAQSVHGETASYFEMGMGVQSCGEFASAYQKSPQMMEMVYFSWAQGYMSAMNVVLGATVAKYRPINPDAKAQMATIRNYCNLHPLANYEQAVLELYSSFPMKPLSPSD